MKGIIFNILEEALTAEFGPDAWNDLVDAAGVQGAYTSLGSYPDAEIVALVDAAAASLSSSPADVLRWFGRKALPLLAGRYGNLIEGHESSRSFILSVNDIIHPEVRKLYSGAGCPHFHFGETDEGALMIGYQSPRRMCHLAEGFVHGAADHFGEAVEVAHLACMTEGAGMCRIAVRWV